MGTEIAPVSGSTGMLWMSCVESCIIVFFASFPGESKEDEKSCLTLNLIADNLAEMTEGFYPLINEGQKKTLLTVRRALDLWKIFIGCNLTYLFPRGRGGIGTLPVLRCVSYQQVVKASSGHIPQPFLIRIFKRTAANINKDISIFQILPFF